MRSIRDVVFQVILASFSSLCFNLKKALQFNASFFLNKFFFFYENIYPNKKVSKGNDQKYENVTIVSFC